MKAVISSTYDDQYLFFIPLVTYLWNKLGVDVICFTPRWGTKEQVKNMIVRKAIENMKCDIFYFDCPPHKMATYTQCSRLYAGSLGLPEEEILLTSDIDMAVFKIPERWCDDGFSITGCDLVPPLQYPMCYISAPAKDWRAVFGDEPYQQKLDQLLGEIEGQEFRGNYWSKDQEEAFNKIGGYAQTGYMQYNTERVPEHSLQIIE